MASLLDGGGTTQNILDPHHRKVNIGVSFEHPNLWLVLMFLGDYVSYSHLPTFKDGTLQFAGQVTKGATVSHDKLDVVIRYDAPPRALTRGQMHNVGCFAAGMPVAAITRRDVTTRLGHRTEIVRGLRRCDQTRHPRSRTTTKTENPDKH